MILPSESGIRIVPIISRCRIVRDAFLSVLSLVALTQLFGSEYRGLSTELVNQTLYVLILVTQLLAPCLTFSTSSALHIVCDWVGSGVDALALEL